MESADDIRFVLDTSSHETESFQVLNMPDGGACEVGGNIRNLLTKIAGS